jgi:hypothetical protein
MNIEEIVNELRQQSDRIGHAISALTGLRQEPSRRGPGRPVGSRNVIRAGRPKRRTMSASARALISAAQKARWAKQKKASPGVVAKGSGRRVMSAAARKRISVAMKRRWAQQTKSS